MALGGLSPDQLTNRHQPCPNCGGTDRYRWDKDEDEGGWFCNQCGGKHHTGGGGNGMDLFLRVTGLDYQSAARRIEQHLGMPSNDPPTKGAEHVWRYSDTFYVCRFPQKKIRPIWFDGTAWRFKAPPAPRPLYNLDALTAKPAARVIIVEGEKAADAAARLFPNAIATTWPSGCKAITKADWSPLAGRDLLLWPDNDTPGRQAMASLAQRLLPIAAAIRIVTPPPDAPEAWDLADATWTPQEAAAYVRDNNRLITTPEPQPEPEPEPEAPPPPPIPSSAPFICLGFDGNNYYYQPNSTGQVIRITGSGHSSTNLMRLAPIEYWEACYPSKTGVNWNAAISSLFATQSRTGVYSPDRIRGRGAWSDDNRAVLHLGDRLIVDGVTHSVMNPPPTRFNYQRLAAIDLPTDIAPLTDEQGYEIIDIASRFHWEVPASGLLLSGWAALAPICGALTWRPHIWLTAGAGSGKSTLLDRFLGPLLDSLALWPEGNTTEAFIRQELRADALPVIFDEAESNEQADRKRIQDILTLARVASSSGRGVIGKGGADGAAQRFTIRSMFLLCSIATALKQGADRSRFAQLTLRNPSYMPKPDRIAHWRSLDDDLTRLITPETGHRLLHRSVQSISVIRNSVAAFRRAAADRFDSQREGDQYGTLLAGAWSLMNRKPATEADAFHLIDSNDWEPYREANEVADEQLCLQTILQHQVRVEADDRSVTRTIGELVEIIMSYRADNEVTSRQAADTIGRHGLKVQPEQKQLIISNTAKAIAAILCNTAWGNGWATILSRLPQAERLSPQRFNGAGAVSRAIAVKIADL